MAENTEPQRPAYALRRRALFTLLSILFAGLLLLVFAEILVRVFWSPGHPRWRNIREFNSEVGMVHVPGQYQWSFRRCVGEKVECTEVPIRFSVNHQGVRGIQDFRKPPGRPLIAVAGDSIVEAAQVDDNDTACLLLEKKLQAQFPDVEVRNLGIMSAGLVHYYERWRKYAASDHPDVLIIAVTVYNDFRNSSTLLEGFAPMRPHYRISESGVREVYFQRWHRSRLEQLELLRFWDWYRYLRFERKEGRSGPDLEIYKEHPEASVIEAISIGREYLARLIREAKAENAEVIVVAIPWRDELLEDEWTKWTSQQKGEGVHFERNRPEQLLRQTAESSGASFYSFYDVARALPREKRYRIFHTNNDFHFSDEGNRLFAESLMPHILDALQMSESNAD